MARRRRGARVIRSLGREPRRLHPHKVPVQAETPYLPPAALYHYWYPERDGVEHCPADFAQKVRDIAGDQIAIVRPPARAPVRCRCWLMFYRKPEVTHPLSPGWFLLRAWNDGHEPHPKPLPLDNRLLAAMWEASAYKWGNAEAYWKHCVSEMQRDKAIQDKDFSNESMARARDIRAFHKIKNIGPGNKFALHHDGSIVPSQGEQNWTVERLKHLLPSQ